MIGRPRRPADVVDAALDRALAEPGCPVCRLMGRAAERYFDGLLWELVNDPGVRQELRASLGLCPRHWWGLVYVEQTVTRNVLGLAILLQDVTARVAEALGARSAQDRRGHSGRWRMRGARPTAGLAERLARCPACKHETWAQQTYLGRLVERLQAAPEAEREWPLCPGHLRAALAPRGSAARLLPRPRVVGPALYGEHLLGADGGTPCWVCSALSSGPRRSGSQASPPAGPGATLCSIHVAGAPAAGAWTAAARPTPAGGHVATLSCPGCEEEAALQAGLLRTEVDGPLCFPHLVERLRLELRPDSGRASKTGTPAVEAVIGSTAAWAAELAERLAGFIRKQDWNVKEPLTEAERRSVRQAALFLGGRRVVVNGTVAG